MQWIWRGTTTENSEQQFLTKAVDSVTLNLYYEWKLLRPMKN